MEANKLFACLHWLNPILVVKIGDIPPSISVELTIRLNPDNFHNHNLIYADANSVSNLSILYI